MRYSSFIVVPAILLASCLPAVTRPDPDDILKLATAASQQLLSARFEGELEFRADQPFLGGMSNGSADITGVMQDRGRLLDFTVSLASQTLDAPESGMDADLHIIVAGQDQVYLQIDALSAGPSGFSVPLLEELKGQWWLLPQSGLSAEQSTLTPDPRFLQLQSESVVVLDDEGYDTINGRRAHHYDVAADKEKLATFLSSVAQSRGQTLSEADALASLADLNMHGELWIDAETYVLHRVQWSIVSNKTSSPLEAVFRLTMRDHNAQVNIQAPDNAQQLPADSVLIPSL